MKANDAAVLRELEEQAPGWLFGLDLVERMQAREDLTWWTKANCGRSSIYVILHRLANDDQVESRYTGEPAIIYINGGLERRVMPRRREYRITGGGIRARREHEVEQEEPDMLPVPA